MLPGDVETTDECHCVAKLGADEERRDMTRRLLFVMTVCGRCQGGEDVLEVIEKCIGIAI